MYVKCHVKTVALRVIFVKKKSSPVCVPTWAASAIRRLDIRLVHDSTGIGVRKSSFSPIGRARSCENYVLCLGFAGTHNP